MQEIAILAKHADFDSPRYCIFNENGGSIGSDSSNTFCLQDKKHSIQEKHVLIQFEEGCFTISNIDDSEIFYNGSFSRLASGYETIIQIGDTFSIGDYTFSFIQPADIQDSCIDNKKIINEVDSHEDLTPVNILPRGKIENVNFKEESIEEILSEKKHMDDFLSESASMPDKSPKDRIFAQKTAEANNGIDQIILSLKKHINSLLITQPPISLELSNIPLDIKDIDNILSTNQLFESPKIANIAILTLIVKELHSPLFEVLDGDLFINQISAALKQALYDDKQQIETLLLKALQTYLNK